MELIDEVKEAVKHYQVKQYDRAFLILKKYLKTKDPTAMYYLALMYYNGQGVKQSFKDAYTYALIAKDGRYLDAFYLLGGMYERGEYVTQNIQQAIEYYQAAFHDGEVQSGLRLAYFFEQGLYFEKNEKKALEIYVECAKKDHPYALYKIGMAYYEGKGIIQSLENAHKWLNKALSKGSMEAMNQFRLVGSKSKNDERSTQTIFSIGKEYFERGKFDDALLYLEIASQEGLADATYLLVRLYDTERDYAASFKLLQETAQAGDAYATYLLAHKYEAAEGTHSSYIQAEALYEKAVHLGYHPAENNLKELRGDF